MLLPNEFLGGIILHPITALLAGLFLAGGLKASGGFEALKGYFTLPSEEPHRSCGHVGHPD